MMFRPFDARRNLAIGKDEEETIRFAVDHLIKTGQEAIANHNAFFLALSGGTTPKKIFHLLASPQYRQSLDWSKVHLFWSDERSVPPSNPDSNYRMAMDAGFSFLPIPKHQIYRMHAEEAIEQNALAYEKTIKTLLHGRPFDLIMLGMGDDGHTASLFPQTEALKVRDRLVVANHVPQKNTDRMTFTFPLINQAKTIVFYVLGPSKADRVARVLLDETSEAPSALIGTPASPALWVLDEAAAELLIKEKYG